MPPTRPYEASGSRCSIRDIRPEDAPPLLELRVRNRAYFEPWEPVPPRNHHTLRAQAGAIEDSIRAWDQDREFAFVILDPDGGLAGRIRLSVVVRAAWRNANLGYYVDEAHTGRGIATDAVGLVLDFAFRAARLHRVQAAVMPRNIGSLRVLEKNGFRREGFALRYLKINRVWEDHLVFAKTVEEH